MSNNSYLDQSQQESQMLMPNISSLDQSQEKSQILIQHSSHVDQSQEESQLLTQNNSCYLDQIQEEINAKNDSNKIRTHNTHNNNNNNTQISGKKDNTEEVDAPKKNNATKMVFAGKNKRLKKNATPEYEKLLDGDE